MGDIESVFDTIIRPSQTPNSTPADKSNSGSGNPSQNQPDDEEESGEEYEEDLEKELNAELTRVAQREEKDPGLSVDDFSDVEGEDEILEEDIDQEINTNLLRKESRDVLRASQLNTTRIFEPPVLERDRDRNLTDLVSSINSIFPDEVINYMMNQGGFANSDIELKKIIAFTVQRFISEVATDAMNYCKLRQQASNREKR